MKLKRRHSQAEVEYRWKAGELWLERTHRSAGEWTAIGTAVEHATIACSLKPRKPSAQALRLAKTLSKTFDNVRLSRLVSERTVHSKSKASWGHDMTYLEIGQGGLRFSRLERSDAITQLEKWAQKCLEFCASPLAMTDIEAETLVLSAEAFGYLLHEAVGHRSESDDFTSPLKRNPTDLKPNFEVWDRAGTAELYGYTPVGDDGTPGTDVRLLGGRSSLLTKETGNLRAASASFHPLIRQRCLDVTTSKEVPPPKGNTILIEEFKLSSFDGEFVILESAMQWLQLKSGAKKRLPSLRILLKPEDIFSWKAFGTKTTYHPSGGCQKGGQSQLPVTFSSPQGWCPLESLHAIDCQDVP